MASTAHFRRSPMLSLLIRVRMVATSSRWFCQSLSCSSSELSALRPLPSSRTLAVRPK